jgi:signal transduction histidine kinase
LQAVIEEIRTAIFDLHSAAPGATRLRQRLDEAIAQFSDGPLRITTHYSGPLSVVDGSLADHAEAVVREAVSNAVRHAHATALTVTVKVDDALTVEVVDNGRGISKPTRRSGLTNMHDRAQQVGGTFTVDTPPAGGTLLRWVAPLP